MPQTFVRVFREADGTAPLMDWLDDLEAREPRAFAKCLQLIRRLSHLGNELRRPSADILRDGIHELRAKIGRVNYRVLYFFYASNTACITHGITKEGKVPDGEIDMAMKRKSLVKADSDKHTAFWER